MILDDEPIARVVGLAAGIDAKARRIAERLLRPIGLTHSQFGVLTAVAEGDGHTPRELAGRLEAEVRAVMVVCSALERKGIVARRADPADRRLRRIVMTARGRRLYERALSVLEELYAPMIRLFPVSELETVVPVLRRVYLHLQERSRSKESRTGR